MTERAQLDRSAIEEIESISRQFQRRLDISLNAAHIRHNLSPQAEPAQLPNSLPRLRRSNWRRHLDHRYANRVQQTSNIPALFKREKRPRELLTLAQRRIQHSQRSHNLASSKSVMTTFMAPASGKRPAYPRNTLSNTSIACRYSSIRI